MKPALEKNLETDFGACCAVERIKQCAFFFAFLLPYVLPKDDPTATAAAQEFQVISIKKGI